MSLRSELTTLLTDGLPAVKVIGYPAGLDAVTKRTLALWATDLTHLDAAPNGHYRVEFTVQLFSQYPDPARADDDLDGFLTDVLEVLWPSRRYVLERAERTTSQSDALQSWTLTVHAGLTITEE